MNWVEILMAIIGLPLAGLKIYRLGHRHAVRKAAEARASADCNDGCGEPIDQDTDVLFKGHWYKPGCWRKLNG